MNELDLSRLSKPELERLILVYQGQLEERCKAAELCAQKLQAAQKEAARYLHEAKRAREQLIGARARYKRKLLRILAD